MSANLLLAIYEEHKQRTGHDGFKMGMFMCDVCLFIGAEKKDQDKAEAEYYKSLESESPAKAE